MLRRTKKEREKELRDLGWSPILMCLKKEQRGSEVS
jgi:hypothetical protein